MVLFQILFSFFVVFVLLKVVGRYQQKELSVGELIFWIIFWLAAEVVVLLPHWSDLIAYALGIGRGADLVIYISLALLFFFFFRLTVKLEKTKRDITKLTRKISLLEAEKIDHGGK